MLPAQAQIFYVGEFSHSLDAKNRLTIPASWRFEGDEGETAYLALPNPNGSITLYPPAEIAKVMERVQKVGPLGAQKTLRDFMRVFSQGARFGCDKSGRIALNPKLIAHAELGKEATLVGSFSHFHIWNPQRYEAFMNRADGELADTPGALAEFGL